MGFDKHGRYHGIKIERYMTPDELRNWRKQQQHAGGPIIGAIFAVLLVLLGGKKH